MKRAVVGAIWTVVMLILSSQPSVYAGVYEDDMVKCFVKSTTEADKTELVKWIFSMVALHPAVRSIAAVSEQQCTELNKKTARLLERLLTDACGAESKTAFKFEGPSALPAAFNLKPETRRDQRADFQRIRCPSCRWQPKAFDRWLCGPCGAPEYFFAGCGSSWNTFTSRGLCPGCGHRWKWTICLRCQGWSLHEDWYGNVD